MTFRPVEQRNQIVYGALFTLGGVFAVIRLARGEFSGFWDTMGLAWVVLLPLALNTTWVSVLVDERGMHVRRPLWRRTFEWQNISDVTVEEHSTRGYGCLRVRLYRHDGGPRWLAAPYVGLRASGPYFEEFHRQADEIKARRRAAARNAVGGETPSHGGRHNDAGR
ncbi:hypothetical protein GCM10022284_31890 [Streptomyces hundungensis]